MRKPEYRRPAYVERIVLRRTRVYDGDASISCKSREHTGTHLLYPKQSKCRALVPLRSDTPPDLRGLIIDMEV